jgi:large subunit ribosomal protein L28e
VRIKKRKKERGKKEKMSNVSADLIWFCTKKSNSFLVKRQNNTFTSEPGNPTNLYSRKYSGLANKRAVDVRAAAKDTVQIVMKKSKDQNKPKKSSRVVKVKAVDPNRVIKLCKKLVSESFYRPSVEQALTKRVAKLAQATTRANKLSKGKLVVKYGRQAQPFEFNKSSKAATSTKTTSAGDDELPPLAPTGTAMDDMD